MLSIAFFNTWLEVYFGINKNGNCEKNIFLMGMGPSRITFLNFEIL
jgi:hypothetical protein